MNINSCSMVNVNRRTSYKKQNTSVSAQNFKGQKIYVTAKKGNKIINKLGVIIASLSTAMALNFNNIFSVDVPKELNKKIVIKNAKKYGGTVQINEDGNTVVTLEYDVIKGKVTPVNKGRYKRVITYSDDKNFPLDVITETSNSPWIYESEQRSILQEDGSYQHWILNQSNKIAIGFCGYDLYGNPVKDIKQSVCICEEKANDINTLKTYTPEQIFNAIKNSRTYHSEEFSAKWHLSIDSALKMGEAPAGEFSLGYGRDAASYICSLVDGANKVK